MHDDFLEMMKKYKYSTTQYTFERFKARWLLYTSPSLKLKKIYIVPAQCIYVFCVGLRTNSDYFHQQH
jgi:hypothetical protein